eukprot:6163304-Prymnesium_polylepis.1
MHGNTRTYAGARPAARPPGTATRRTAARTGSENICCISPCPTTAAARGEGLPPLARGEAYGLRNPYTRTQITVAVRVAYLLLLGTWPIDGQKSPRETGLAPLRRPGRRGCALCLVFGLVGRGGFGVWCRSLGGCAPKRIGVTVIPQSDGLG